MKDCEVTRASQPAINNEPRGNQEVIKQIQSLQRAVMKEKSIGACKDGKGNWQRLALAVDSGACDNVIDPKDIAAYEEHVTETEASANNEKFLAANGVEIGSYGQKLIEFVPVFSRPA